MKKIVLFAVLAVMFPCLGVQAAVNTAAIERAAKTAKDQKAAQVNVLSKEVVATFKDFQKQVFRYQYYEYNFMFQAMDGLRVSYMKLRELSPLAARALAPVVNKPVSIANGQRSIRLETYLNMETCNLWQSEQSKFDAFGKALKEDLQQGVSLPADFKNVLKGYREYIQKAERLNSGWVLQSMMPVMDSFNRYVQENAALAPVMAQMIQEPITAGWGGKVVTSTFIKDHACELWQIGDQLEDFRDNLLKYTR